MIEMKLKENHMTQKYYTDKILPQYVKEYQRCMAFVSKAILQEDNDGSHDTFTRSNYAARYKRRYNIESLIHSANSPDLNPIEAIWNILKQSVRHYTWSNLDELRGILQLEWTLVTQEEIQARIEEMPWRCELLTRNGGAIIKSEHW